MPITAVIMVMLMPAAIRLYSMEAAAESSAKKCRMMRIARAFLVAIPTGILPVSQTELRPRKAKVEQIKIIKAL
jgi:hypothetical protein